MEERLKFVARLLEGEKMASLCREFGISRKTGYKIFNRYKQLGIDGLNDQSPRPHRYANQLPFQVERRKAKRYRAQGTELSHGRQPNALWCADYKGEFLLGNKSYCYPLTITDYKTRYLLARDALDSTKEAYAITVFERTFQEFGLPNAIRTDNGTAFASRTALFGLSKLSVWWLRLGINIERMHLTLKKEATKPPSFNFLQQQERFDEFIEIYNHDRPHQALSMKYPGELYTPSARVYRPPEEPEYPFHDRTVRVTNCGRICLDKRKISFSRAMANQVVGIREVSEKIWLVSFIEYDLEFFDQDESRVVPDKNPFTPKVLPMSSV